jgi:hypothetical protein
MLSKLSFDAGIIKPPGDVKFRFVNLLGLLAPLSLVRGMMVVFGGVSIPRFGGVYIHDS